MQNVHFDERGVSSSRPNALTMRNALKFLIFLAARYPVAAHFLDLGVEVVHRFLAADLTMAIDILRMSAKSTTKTNPFAAERAAEGLMPSAADTAVVRDALAQAENALGGTMTDTTVVSAGATLAIIREVLECNETETVGRVQALVMNEAAARRTLQEIAAALGAGACTDAALVARVFETRDRAQGRELRARAGALDTEARSLTARRVVRRRRADGMRDAVVELEGVVAERQETLSQETSRLGRTEALRAYLRESSS